MIILAGDSAGNYQNLEIHLLSKINKNNSMSFNTRIKGGNALAVITQKLLLNKRKLPNLQILIYPRMQLINFRLPSSIKYANTGLVASLGINARKFNAWYLGLCA